MEEKEKEKEFNFDEKLKTTEERLIEIINTKNSELRDLIIEKTIKKIENETIEELEEIKQENKTIKEELEDF